MKKINKFTISHLLLATCTLLCLSGCRDMLDTDPKDILSSDDYVQNEDEMYKGMLGILNRVQEAGDQSIFLLDTRCNYLQTTENAPNALQDIYNYEETDGNEYADPTCYYAIIVACNDYFNKMEEYHHNVGGLGEMAETNFVPLLSSAIRIKVWAYYMLGRIYGEAYWFDDPLTEMKDLSDTQVFTYCTMEQLVDKCLNLLDNGMIIDGVNVPADQEMQWYKWLDEENQQASLYYKWQYLTPPHLLLKCELTSWKCNYLTEEAARPYWQWMRDNILTYLYNVHNGVIAVTGVSTDKDDSGNFTESLGYIYQLNIPLQSDATNAYFRIFCTENIGSRMQMISSIMYDYDNHQRNRLVQYFCPTWPGTDGFYLKPSDYGVGMYNEQDLRSPVQKMVASSDLNGSPAVTKFYYCYDFTDRIYKYLREKIFEIQPTIITFRGHDWHFLLAEAENHLGHWWPASAIIGKGLTNEFADKTIPFDPQWGDTLHTVGSQGQDSIYFKEDPYPYDFTWFGNNGGYGNTGLAGTMLDQTSFRTSDGQLIRIDSLKWYCQDMPESERIRIYDEALAYEYIKEYIAEGKGYSYLCKIADRYDGKHGRGTADQATEIVANWIAPKYAAEGKSAKVRSYLQNNGYYIKWNLRNGNFIPEK